MSEPVSAAPPVWVRRATRADLAVAHPILMGAFAATADTPHPSSALRLTESDLAEAVEAEILWCLGLNGADKVVGCLQIEEKGGALIFSRLAVEPMSQGRGIGGAVLSWIEGRARALGCRRVVCTARSIYPDNRPFYLRHGYIITGYSGRYGVTDIRTHLCRILPGPGPLSQGPSQPPSQGVAPPRP